MTECEGEYHHQSRKNILEWRIPVIDEANKTGSMEFSIHGHPDDFFPVVVAFVSKRPYSDIEVRPPSSCLVHHSCHRLSLCPNSLKQVDETTSSNCRNNGVPWAFVGKNDRPWAFVQINSRLLTFVGIMVGSGLL